MEFAMNDGFVELSMDCMYEFAGGGWLEAAQAFGGSVLVAISPAVGVGVGIVAGPIAGVAAGIGCASGGCTMIGAACH